MRQISDLRLATATATQATSSKEEDVATVACRHGDKNKNVADCRHCRQHHEKLAAHAFPHRRWRQKQKCRHCRSRIRKSDGNLQPPLLQWPTYTHANQSGRAHACEEMETEIQITTPRIAATKEIAVTDIELSKPDGRRHQLEGITTCPTGLTRASN